MKIDTQKLKPYIDDKLISVQKHPEFDLYIYNYTQKAQYSGTWDEMTKMCRGLILDGQGNVIARPFDKFFNVGEREDEEIRIDPKMTARDKMDGSLGILYKRPDGKPGIATRGSFTSDQAMMGEKMLWEVIHEHPSMMFVDGMTYLFEIIYPENRIVVDYGHQKKLVLLAARHNETGRIFLPEETGLLMFFEGAVPIDNFAIPRDGAEGVVIYYPDGYLCKVKYAEYVRLHRLVTGCTARSIWDLLKQNNISLMGTQESVIQDLIDRVPEEFASWVKTTAKNLVDEFVMCEARCFQIVDEARKLPSRREQAEYIIATCNEIPKKGLSGVCFLILDSREHTESIWRLLRPAHETPFKKDIDA